MKISKKIWLVNIGEPLPIEGNRSHRMSVWKTQLEAAGYEIKFFTSDFEHQRKKWIHIKPNGYILLKSYIAYNKNISIARLVNHFLVSISLFKTFRKQVDKPDTILVSYPTIWLSLVSVIYGKLNGIKVIVDVRDKWPDIFIIHPFFYIVMWPLFLLKKIIFNNANKLIAISPGYYNWALPEKKIDQNNILPLVLPENIKIDRDILPNKCIKLLFVGSLGTTYDLDMLLLINDILTQENIPFQIHVCGDGPRMSWLKQKIIHKNKIKILGWLNKHDLEIQFNEAHFGLMLYSDNAPQGWPNKLVEYMANGLPIINTLKGESWDLIESEKLGINLHLNNIYMLVDWLSDLIDNNNLYKVYVQ